MASSPATILAGACRTFREFCVEGAELNEARIAEHVNRSLMLVTALSPVIGYDRAAEIAHRADANGSTLREASRKLGHTSSLEFDRLNEPALKLGDDPTYEAGESPIISAGSMTRSNSSAPM